jgi:hypothetical protein
MRSYRSKESIIFGSLFGVLAGVVGVASLPELVGAGSPSDRIVVGLVVIAFLYFAVRGFTLGLAQTDHDIRIRTMQWTYHYQRPEVTRFMTVRRPVSPLRRSSRTYLAIELRSGDTRIFWPFSSTSQRRGSDDIDAIAENLNRSWSIDAPPGGQDR